jgi:hypothetical protein
MNTFSRRIIPVAALLGLAIVSAPGCVVGPAGTYGDPNYGVGADYYEPYGGVYGGWGDDFMVGPYGYGGHGGGGGRGGGAQQHSFRGAAPGRAAPSIPSGGRGGGGRGGGGRGGGGGNQKIR